LFGQINTSTLLHLYVVHVLILQLLKALPVLQKQIDALLEVDVCKVPHLFNYSKLFLGFMFIVFLMSGM